MTVNNSWSIYDTIQEMYVIEYKNVVGHYVQYYNRDTMTTLLPLKHSDSSSES